MEGIQVTSGKKFLKGFTIFVVIISITIFIFENINGKFFLNDYKVYYLASKSLVSGDKVYGIAYGLSSGFYKYSPVILLFFIPFSFIPYYYSAVFFYILIVFSIIQLFYSLRFILNNYVFSTVPRYENIIYSLAFLFVLNQIYRELHLGNTNIILLLILMLSLAGILKSKSVFSGIWFGLAILFKPFFLILILPVILLRKWKVLLYGLFSAVFFFLLFIIFFGAGNTLQLHHEWMNAILDHSTSYPSTNTIDSILRHYTNISFAGFSQYIIIAFFALLYIILELFTAFADKNKNISPRHSELRIIFGWFALLAILPNIVNTDTEHFLYSLPLILFITYYLFENKNWPLRIIFFILFLMYGLNSRDIIGRQISDIMNDYGILGISNILIFILGITLFFRTYKKTQEQTLK